MLTTAVRVKPYKQLFYHSQASSTVVYPFLVGCLPATVGVKGFRGKWPVLSHCTLWLAYQICGRAVYVQNQLHLFVPISQVFV